MLTRLKRCVGSLPSGMISDKIDVDISVVITWFGATGCRTESEHRGGPIRHFTI